MIYSITWFLCNSWASWYQQCLHNHAQR